MLPHINKERTVPGSWYSNLAFAIKYPPHECAETGGISLSCYSKHDILCAAQDIFFSHEYKSPAIYYEIFFPDWHPIMYIQSSSNKISSDQYTICAKSLLAALAINSAAKPKMERYLVNWITRRSMFGARKQRQEAEKQGEEKAAEMFFLIKISFLEPDRWWNAFNA